MKRATHFCDFLTFCSAISIHALVKRATILFKSLQVGITYFNPRPREEGDLCVQGSILIICYFNPRPREEGDTIYNISIIICFYFNPRPREEGDLAMGCVYHV